MNLERDAKVNLETKLNVNILWEYYGYAIWCTIEIIIEYIYCWRTDFEQQTNIEFRGEKIVLKQQLKLTHPQCNICCVT